MMEIYSKITASFQPKEPIKLFLPTHDMPWKIPYQRKSFLADEIDGILEGIRQTHAKKKKVYLASISTYGIGMPSQGGWVLVDMKDGSLVRKNYIESLVHPGGEYIVLCIGATEIPRGILRPFHTKEGEQDEDEDGDTVFVDAVNGENIDEVA